MTISKTQLSINVNKIALLRNSRGEDLPNLLKIAKDILITDIVGITVHPRSDGRHVVPNDVFQLKKLIDQFSNKELNIEGNPFHLKQNSYPGFIELVKTIIPHQATLVPDSEYQLTSNHGWNLKQEYKKIELIIKTLKDYHIRISLFMNPDTTLEELKIAKSIGTDRIELYTDLYTKLYEKDKYEEAIKPYLLTSENALQTGLEINAGHGLSQKNLGFFIKELPCVKEVSIGHALICEALENGLLNTINEYLKILRIN